MEYRKLGNTGLEVSVIALGCEAFVEDNSTAKTFLNLVIAHNVSNGIKEGSPEFRIPDTERGHYAALDHHASECLQCGMCETRCPFDVKIRENMKHAEAVFGF